MYRIGFLGYEFMGKAHANALARLPMFFPDAPGTDRHVLVGRDEEALAEAADRLGFSTTATDWRDVLDDIDVLYNLGPNWLHVEPTIEALDRGVDVFCEKPLAPTVEGAERVVAAARRSDAMGGIGFNFRAVPALVYAKHLIDDGVLGDIHHVRGRYLQDWLVDPEAPWSWRNDEEAAGSGALGDLGAHTVDLIQYLVGDVTRVCGQLKTFVDQRPVEGEDARGTAVGQTDDSEAATKPVTVDDAYTANVELDNGAVGTVEASRVANGRKNDHTIEIEGSEGSLRYTHERLNELEVLRDDQRGYQTVLVTDSEDPYIDRWWPPGHTIGWEHTFVHENYEFLRSLERNEQFQPDFRTGLRVQRVLGAIEQSDTTDSWITI